MLAYKFRSSAQLGLALDIIFDRRLHCADWTTFNDPREGFFEYSPHDNQKAQAIRAAKGRYKVCCLSQTFGSRLLWAHYAAGFDGLAVEVDLPTAADDDRIHSVTYNPALPNAARYGGNFDAIALAFLSRKDRDWSYENEVRIIQTDTWFQLAAPVQRIIVGRRFSKSLLRALRLVCEDQNIELKCASIENRQVVAHDCAN
jgi:hypothetical protein